MASSTSPLPGTSTVNARWIDPDGTVFAVVQFKPSMEPHLVTTRPGEVGRGRLASAAEIAAARRIMEATP